MGMKWTRRTKCWQEQDNNLDMSPWRPVRTFLTQVNKYFYIFAGQQEQALTQWSIDDGQRST